MRKSLGIKMALLVCLASVVLTSGCAHRRRYVETREVYVTEAPPAVVQEEVTVSPSPGYVWVGGEWVWRDRRWDWNRGHWVTPPRHGTVWVPGRYYVRGDGRHVYVAGHWR